MPTPAELLEQSLTALRNAKRFSAPSQSYRKDNPNEYEKVIAYLDGGARPSGVTTEMGKHAVLEEDVRRALLVTPPELPVARLFDSLDDFDGAFVSGWIDPITQGVTVPAGRGGGIYVVDTPHGKGFRLVCTDAMKTLWDASMKTCTLQGYYSPLGATEDWRFYFNIPSSGNPNGIPATWTGMVIWECGHTATASGHSVCIDGSPGSTLDMHFRRNRAPWGSGDYDFYRIGAPQFDHWYECRQEVKWSAGADGFVRFTVDGAIICDYSGATLPQNDSPRLNLCNYSTITGTGTNEVVIAGVRRL